MSDFSRDDNRSDVQCFTQILESIEGHQWKIDQQRIILEDQNQRRRDREVEIKVKEVEHEVGKLSSQLSVFREDYYKLDTENIQLKARIENEAKDFTTLLKSNSDFSIKLREAEDRFEKLREEHWPATVPPSDPLSQEMLVDL